MALVDDLVGRVPDGTLRQELTRAVADLKRRRHFGLVFEEHVPETIALPGVRVRPGMIVQRRDAPDDRHLYRVEDVQAHEAVVVRSDANGHPLRCDTSNLLVIKRLGEPIYPGLTSLGVVERGGMRPHHAVINGENFHALELLTYLFEGQVDAIYIDPPYNTGARDWTYNNNYVDDNDAWRHSKWLAMMEKRLRLAKRLLKPDGVLVVMIDEHELHHLGMLIEGLFPEFLRYLVSIVINARGSTGKEGNFGSIAEYALFVVPNLGYDVIQPREAVIPDFKSSTNGSLTIERLLAKVAQACPDIPKELEGAGLALDEDELDEWRELSTWNLSLWDEDDLDREAPTLCEAGDVADEEDPAVYWRGAVRTGQGTSFRTQRPKQFYPLLFDPQAPDRIEVGEALLVRDENNILIAPSWEKVEGLTPIWPVDEEGAERVWCYEPGRMRAEIASGNIRIGRFNPKRNTHAVNVRRVRRTRQRFRERTIWWEKSYDAGSNGTNILKNLLGASGLFPFPKSIYAVRDVLATVVGSRPDALILDFFAGSGTTLHSTCLLNAIDRGRRRCILVTNNEVDEKTASDLERAGHFRGDPEFEAMGIFERVTVPRVKAAVSGRRSSGSELTGKYKWAGKRLLSEGFDENVEFFRLDYLDRDDVDLGLHIGGILPALWLATGGIGPREVPSSDAAYSMPEGAQYAVLLKDSRFGEFRSALEQRPDIAHAYVVTDSEEAFAEMRSMLPDYLSVRMLYADYIRAFDMEPAR